MVALSESNEVHDILNTNSCPPWFVYNNNSDGEGGSRCECKENFGDVVTCDEKLQKSYLQLSHCMTYNSGYSDEQESDAVSFGLCPYIYYSNIVNNRFIALPQNTSNLKSIFCTPLNRDGLLCEDCIDGFGPIIIFIVYACANCTENNYGWMLYILSEFVPATVFYIVVLTLRVQITSAPMNCFVMLSQLLVTLLNHDPGFHEALISQLDKISHTILKVTFTGYGFLNLDYFRYFIPPLYMCEPRPQEHPRPSSPVCVCLLSTIAHCSYIHLC